MQCEVHSTNKKRSSIDLFPHYRSSDLDENADGAVEMGTHSIAGHSVEEHRVNGKLQCMEQECTVQYIKILILYCIKEVYCGDQIAYM